MSSLEQRASGVWRVSPVERHDPARPLAIEVRGLGSGDRVQLETLLRSLDEASRMARFNAGVTDAQLGSHADRALSQSGFIAGAFVDGRLCGVVEVYPYGRLGFAEAAFAVDQDWRRRGIGTSLLHAAMTWCARSGVPVLRMVFSPTNLPMRRLATKAPARLDLAPDEMTADVSLAA
jgi:GNAT superfamily N-acetyltransferase